MPHNSRVIAILGASLSGNKGAASMLLAVADGVQRRIPGATVCVFSPYGLEDKRNYPHLDIATFAPFDMLCVLPAACVFAVSGGRWKLGNRIVGRLSRADVVADVSGVAFMDGRGWMTLAYNVLLVIIPWALSVPVVKIAQAVGPFNERTNRVAARSVLRLVRWVGLRGSDTISYFRDLGLHNGERAADVAFLLEIGSQSETAAIRALPDKRTVTVFSPSTVMQRMSEKVGIDYVGRMVALAHRLEQDGHQVVIVAHSARKGAKGGPTNDLPLCRRIAAETGVQLIDREIDAREMRALIGRSRLLITSRFHAMISGLVTRTPTLVIAWSHKYREVLAEFGLEQWAKDFRSLDDDDLYMAVLRLESQREDFRDSIDSHIAGVNIDAERNLDRLASVIEGTL